jgi:hypothetical protein
MQETRKIAQEVVWVKWVKDQEARKLPGRKTLDTYLSLLEKNLRESPFK